MNTTYNLKNKFFDLYKLDISNPDVYKTSFDGSQKPYEFHNAWDRIDKHFDKYPTDKITFLEIGAFRGLWAEALRAYGRYKNIDIHYSTITFISHNPDNNKKLYEIQKLYQSEGKTFDLIPDSSLVESSLKQLPLTSYNIVFIDGNHSYEAVMIDNSFYCPLASDIILWHDVIGLPEVKRAIDDSKISLDEVIGKNEGKTSMGIGIKYIKK
jgi:hypothetical protein